MKEANKERNIEISSTMTFYMSEAFKKICLMNGLESSDLNFEYDFETDTLTISTKIMHY